MKNIDLRYYFEREIKNLHIQYADMQRHYTLCRKLITQSMADSEVQETVKQYIRTHMPSTDMYSVTEIIPENCTDVPFLANHISRYLVTNNMEYEDTLLGYYVSAEIRSVIMDTLNYIVPLKEGFELTTKQAGVSSTVADYNRFLRYILSKQKDLVVVIKNHPLYLQFREFYDVRSDKIQILIDQWCSLELGDTPSGDPRYMSLGEAAVLLDCTKETLIESLQAGWKYAQTDSFQILLEEEYVRKMYDDIRSLIEVDQYVKKIAEQNKMPWRCAKEVLDGFIATENPVWVMRGSEFPGKNAEQYYFFGKEEETARSAFSKLIQTHCTYPLAVLKQYTQLDNAELIMKAESGQIKAILTDGTYRVSYHECKRIQELSNAFVCIDDALAPVMDEESSFTLSDAKCRRIMKEYLITNDFFGLSVEAETELPLSGKKTGLIILRNDAQFLCERMKLFFLCYGKAQDEKTSLVLEEFSNLLPDTVKSLREYLMGMEKAYSDDTILTMVDGLLTLVPKELSQCDEPEIEDIIRGFVNKTRASCEMLSDFLFSRGYTRRKYEYPKSDYRPDVSAYPKETFELMVRAVVDRTYWTEHNLLEKAIECPKYADAWLCVAMHIFAAWRWPDYIRCTPPVMRYPPDVVLQKIRDGEYTDNDAIYVSTVFLKTIELKWKSPNKTRRYGGVPRLYIHCGEEFLAEFGMILSIATAHIMLTGRQNLIQPTTDMRTFGNFFGKEMVDACGGKAFSSRRANKALLQVVQSEAINSGSAAYLAYVMATIMRAHKSEYGRLSATTDIYLRYSRFPGCDAQEIVAMLFQRGICSFTIDALLAECYGKTYTALPLENRNDVICAVGLTPAKLDDIVRFVQHAEDVAVENVREILMRSDQSASEILKSVLSDCSKGKDKMSHCVCIAANMKCMCPERTKCFGCKFEIRTKGMIIDYLKALYQQYHLQTKGNLSNAEMEKSKWICKNMLEPAIREIYVHMPSDTVTEELQMYAEIAEICKLISEEGN